MQFRLALRSHSSRFGLPIQRTNALSDLTRVAWHGQKPLVYEPSIWSENHAANPATYGDGGNDPFEPPLVFNELGKSPLW